MGQTCCDNFCFETRRGKRMQNLNFCNQCLHFLLFQKNPTFSDRYPWQRWANSAGSWPSNARQLERPLQRSRGSGTAFRFRSSATSASGRWTTPCTSTSCGWRTPECWSARPRTRPGTSLATRGSESRVSFLFKKFAPIFYRFQTMHSANDLRRPEVFPWKRRWIKWLPQTFFSKSTAFQIYATRTKLPLALERTFDQLFPLFLSPFCRQGLLTESTLENKFPPPTTIGF